MKGEEDYDYVNFDDDCDEKKNDTNNHQENVKGGYVKLKLYMNI